MSLAIIHANAEINREMAVAEEGKSEALISVFKTMEAFMKEQDLLITLQQQQIKEMEEAESLAEQMQEMEIKELSSLIAKLNDKTAEIEKMFQAKILELKAEISALSIKAERFEKIVTLFKNGNTNCVIQ